MPNEPEFKDPRIYELEVWKDLIQSDNWKYFKELLSEHKENLEKQVLIAVASKKFDDAMCYQARASEATKILQLVEGRLAELRKTRRDDDGK